MGEWRKKVKAKADIRHAQRGGAKRTPQVTRSERRRRVKLLLNGE